MLVGDRLVGRVDRVNALHVAADPPADLAFNGILHLTLGLGESAVQFNLVKKSSQCLS